MTKCWTTMAKRNEGEALSWRVTGRGNVKSEWQVSERRRDTATVHTERLLRPSASKGTKTQTHCQHAIISGS